MSMSGIRGRFVATISLEQRLGRLRSSRVLDLFGLNQISHTFSPAFAAARCCPLSALGCRVAGFALRPDCVISCALSLLLVAGPMLLPHLYTHTIFPPRLCTPHCRLLSLLPQGLVSFVASFLCFLKALFLLSPPFFASSRPCSFVFPRQSLPRINEALCFTASLSTHEHLTCCPPTPSALRCRFPLNTQVSGVGSRV